MLLLHLRLVNYIPEALAIAHSFDVDIPEKDQFHALFPEELRILQGSADHFLLHLLHQY